MTENKLSLTFRISS